MFGFEGIKNVPSAYNKVYSSLAQSVEHLTVNQGVVGSSPTGGAKTEKVTQSVAFFVLIFSIEFEQRLLILNRQQPEGRLTAMFAPRSLRRGQTCAPVRSVAEAGGLLQGVVGSSPTGGPKISAWSTTLRLFLFSLLNFSQ